MKTILPTHRFILLSLAFTIVANQITQHMPTIRWVRTPQAEKLTSANTEKSQENLAQLAIDLESLQEEKLPEEEAVEEAPSYAYYAPQPQAVFANANLPAYVTLGSSTPFTGVSTTTPSSPTNTSGSSTPSTSSQSSPASPTAPTVAPQPTSSPAVSSPTQSKGQEKKEENQQKHEERHEEHSKNK